MPAFRRVFQLYEIKTVKEAVFYGSSKRELAIEILFHTLCAAGNASSTEKLGFKGFFTGYFYCSGAWQTEEVRCMTQKPQGKEVHYGRRKQYNDIPNEAVLQASGMDRGNKAAL